MKLLDYRLALDRLLKRERQGSTVSPSDFNRLIGIASRQEFEVLRRQYELNNDIVNDLRPFIVKQSVNCTAGVINIPSGYVKTASLLDSNGNVIDEVTQMEYREIKKSSILAPTTDEKVYYTIENEIHVDPATSETMTMVYLREPAEPYLDYYVNTAGNIVYLGERETVDESLIDAEYKTYGKDGSPIQIAGGVYTSQTTELEWITEGSHVRIFARLLALAGLTVPDTLSIQYALGYDTKTVD
jgi:hypothetical protein